MVAKLKTGAYLFAACLLILGFRPAPHRKGFITEESDIPSGKVRWVRNSKGQFMAMFDERGNLIYERLLSRWDITTDSCWMLDYLYRYDKYNNMVERMGGGFDNRLVRKYSDDSAHDLVKEEMYSYHDQLVETGLYRYERHGNRKEVYGSWNDTFYHSATLVYNEEGRVTEELRFSAAGKQIESERNTWSNGHLKEVVGHGYDRVTGAEDVSSFRHEQNDYDAHGNRVERRTYFIDGRLSSRSAWTYLDKNNAGRFTETDFDKRGKIKTTRKTTYRYNTYGWLMEEIMERNGRIRTINTYADFDDSGNYLKKTIFQKDMQYGDKHYDTLTLHVEREIEYYH